DLGLLASRIVRDQHQHGIFGGPQVELGERHHEALEDAQLRPPQAITDDFGGGIGAQRGAFVRRRKNGHGSILVCYGIELIAIARKHNARSRRPGAYWLQDAARMFESSYPMCAL